MTDPGTVQTLVFHVYLERRMGQPRFAPARDPRRGQPSLEDYPRLDANGQKT